MVDSNEIRPNPGEIDFLNIAYSKFLDLFDIIFDNVFWDKTPNERFVIISQGFAIYAELLNYQPISWYIDHLKTNRPPMEGEIAEELFKFIRNVIAHFPVFDSWDEIYISRQLANWDGDGRSIDRFLKKYQGGQEVKYRFWEKKVEKMTYLTVSFPRDYEKGNKIFLKDILDEESGVKFAFMLMKQVLLSQVESIGVGDGQA